MAHSTPRDFEERSRIITCVVIQATSVWCSVSVVLVLVTSLLRLSGGNGCKGWPQRSFLAAMKVKMDLSSSKALVRCTARQYRIYGCAEGGASVGL